MTVTQYGVEVRTYGNGQAVHIAKCECGWAGPERPRLAAATADHRKHDKNTHQ